MTIIYTCEGFRKIIADDDIGVYDAASIFANRLARRTYGRKGYCRTARRDGWTRDGTVHHFECFIGFTPRWDRNITQGHNEWLTVYRHATEESRT